MNSVDGGRFRLRPGDRIAVIAGSGMLPVDVVGRLVEIGQNPLVLLVEGEGRPGDFLDYETLTLPIEAFPQLPAIIRKHRLTHLVMAGGIARRPSLWRVRPNLALVRDIPRVLRALASGDNKLLSILVKSLERYGVSVVGAHEIVPDLLAPAGVVTRRVPLESDRADLRAAWRAAKAIGALDIGQAAVAIGGRAVELEGIAGTADLLERVARIRTHGRLAGRKGGVLVKCAKPGQELRADLPTIGLDTISSAHVAGLAGIGVEASRSIILQSAEAIALADRHGLFIMGLGEGDL